MRQKEHSKIDSGTDTVLERLEVLRRKLEDDGLYVRANTVTLAIEEIKRLRR